MTKTTYKRPRVNRAIVVSHVKMAFGAQEQTVLNLSLLIHNMGFASNCCASCLWRRVCFHLAFYFRIQLLLYDLQLGE